ncbi:MAG: AIR carboxylase family protein [Candidatus Omnitrophica bacterium]|nr:AIR carboxylase family protein [Candidatus Omnitrophota bacterium]
MQRKIAVITGSKSDIKYLEDGLAMLKKHKISYSLDVISAHRNPQKLTNFCKQLEKNNVEVVIACAGMAAALPGFVASLVNIPVIGVAMEGGIAGGLDALFSIVSTPKGLGIASTGLGKSAFINAVIFSLEILSLKDKKYLAAVKKIKESFR